VIGPDTPRPSERSEPSPAPPSWADLDHALDFDLDLDLDLDLDRRIDLGDLHDRRPAGRIAEGGSAGATSSASQQLAERLGVGSVDPLLLRLGTLVLIGVLMVPLALMVRATPEDEVRMGSNLVAATASRMPAGRDTARSTVPVPDSLPAAAAVTDDVVVGQAPHADAPVCALSYTVGAGDYWLRIAEESGLDLATVLAANGASTDTAIHPGDQVCLPAGATMPSAPPAPTTAPPTTAPPTTAPPTTAPPTTAPPTTAPLTTAPPTTAPAGPPPTTAPMARASGESPEQVVALIREIWPDDLEERAITIARRESSLRPGAYNGHCCYGVFQIYWSSHRNWLANHGVTSSAQLLDARTNIKLAYEIYRRAGGWGPWSQTAH
jgi:LysM repeat protein